jgi:hypothetical protein
MRCINLDFNMARLGSTYHRMRGYCYQSLRNSSGSLAILTAILQTAAKALSKDEAGVTAIVLIASLVFLIAHDCLGCSQIAQDKKRLARDPASLRSFPIRCQVWDKHL